jgi:hypothetical protein
LANNPPVTTARTSHAITIKTQSGTGPATTIGLIKQWNPVQTRDVNPIYEINIATSGDPLENIPGNMRGLTIKVQRYDLYTIPMEIAFGTSDLVFLSDQNSPFQVMETWRFPNNTYEAWNYTGCWFSNIGKNYQSDDNRMVLVDATLVYVARLKIQTPGA